MLNLKKGLAVVLAAATALTFTPVANLGGSSIVEAQAAGNELIKTTGSVDLVKTHNLVFDTGVDWTVDTSFKIKVTVSDDAAGVKIAKYTDDDTAATAASEVDLGKNEKLMVSAPSSATAGKSTTINYEYTKNSAIIRGSFAVNVKAQGSDPAITLTGDSGALNANFASAAKVTDANRNVHVDTTHKYKITLAASEDTKITAASVMKGATSNNTAAVEVDNTDPASPKLTFKAVGKATITVTYTAPDNSDDGSKKANQDYTVSTLINVITTGSTFKIDGKEVTANALTATDKPIETVVLTADHSSQKISTTLDNPQNKDEKPVFKSVLKSTGGATITSASAATDADFTALTNVSNDIYVKDGVIYAKANALNATEQYYDVLVTNNLTKATAANVHDVAKKAVIRVVTINRTKDFTFANVNIDGKDYKAQAEYSATGQPVSKTGADATQAKVTLSTKDKTSVPFVVTTNVAAANLEVKSSNTGVVAVENNTLVAKGLGTAQVTVVATSDATHYGDAQVTVSVEVTDQLVDNKITASDVTLTKAVKKGNPNAKAQSANTTLSYRFVKQNAKGEWEEASDDNLTLDKKTGDVTYVTTETGSATLEISGNTTTDALAPAPVRVKVTYTSAKAPSQLKVDQTAVNVDAGETATVAATGTAITVKSSDDAVATASYADGKVSVTGVKKGVAVVTVTDAGDDNFEGSSAQIVVYVAGAKMTKPAKVTGVKVTNLKGGKVKVTWTKVGTNPNIKYYVKKTIGKKSAGKSVGSNSTTLTVKKGATVKVKVKAYIYDENGEKFVGSYSSTVSKKTDKK